MAEYVEMEERLACRFAQSLLSEICGRCDIEMQNGIFKWIVMKWNERALVEGFKT